MDSQAPDMITQRLFLFSIGLYASYSVSIHFPPSGFFYSEFEFHIITRTMLKPLKWLTRPSIDSSMASSLCSIPATAAAPCAKSSSRVSTLLALAVYCLFSDFPAAVYAV